MEKTLLLKYTYFQKAVRWLCVDARLVFGKLVEIPQFGLVTEETHRSIDGIYSLFGNVRPKAVFRFVDVYFSHCFGVHFEDLVRLLLSLVIYNIETS